MLFSVTTHRWLEPPTHLTESYMFFLGLRGCREDVAGFGVPVLRSGCSCFPTMGRWGFGRGQNEASGHARKRKLLCPPKCGQIQKGKNKKNVSYTLLPRQFPQSQHAWCYPNFFWPGQCLQKSLFTFLIPRFKLQLPPFKTTRNI